MEKSRKVTLKNHDAGNRTSQTPNEVISSITQGHPIKKSKKNKFKMQNNNIHGQKTSGLPHKLNNSRVKDSKTSSSPTKFTRSDVDEILERCGKRKQLLVKPGAKWHEEQVRYKYFCFLCCCETLLALSGNSIPFSCCHPYDEK